jgi:asparagine synthase (glutamine-hydrolysing)
MKAARKAGIKVLLDGQGGDELLGGYSYFYRSYFHDLFNEMIKDKSEKSFRRFQKHLKEVSLIKSINLSGLLKSDYVSRPVNDSLINRDLLLSFGEKELNRPLKKKFNNLLTDHLYHATTRTSLPALLHFEDRNSMAFSIEARTPFLDVRLVEAVFSMSSEWKINGKETKRVLRHGMKNVLPNSIINREDKMGYNTPICRWLRNGWKGSVSDILDPSRIKRRSILDPDLISEMWQEHLGGVKDHSWQIWRWITLDRWFEIFIENGIPSLSEKNGRTGERSNAGSAC